MSGLGRPQSDRVETVLNFDGADPMLDIEIPMAPALPPVAALLGMVGISFRDKVLELMMQREFSALTGVIGSSIGTKSLGYLLKIRLWVNEYGVPVVPGGQLLEAIGPGHEPLDALAESMASSILKVPDPVGNLRDASSYMWVRRQGGKFVASQMPSGTLRAFENDAAAEADRRIMMRSATRMASDGLLQVTRAAFWTQVATDRIAQIADGQRRQAIQDLTNRFSQAEKAFNAAYAEYHRLEAEMMASRERAAVLDKIATVLAVMEGGLKAQKFFTSDGKKVGMSRAEDSSLAADRAKTLNRAKAVRDLLLQHVPAVNEKGEKLRSLDVEIRTTYGQENAVIPHSDPVILPKVEIPGPL